ncbi:LuxR family transcriptional regulator protein [Rhizobium phage RHEph18]|uniref:response regulator transcription factor n=1 Tax=Rhizobium TaxID=379 RepID=UPI0007EBC54B|nr:MULTISPECIES: helix-turn-helix transcriptional regulator [Rhizobium]ANL02681.1 response regulator domain-containing protein [Rhizobium esperanzae]ANM33533.1 response regulator domain-containing protein [Rhizobium sp. N871]QIG73766.1 LuxR family transcriptional regulator protein [Rhizobium phage RHph_N2]QXV74484.1 LuxR family transcriptional regulator protein [Rhizobium phage RHEph18]
MSVALEPHMTQRETEIIKWVSHGKTAYEIGIILGISEPTIHHHIASARAKLDAMNSTHLVAKALRRGIIT